MKKIYFVATIMLLALILKAKITFKSEPMENFVGITERVEAEVPLGNLVIEEKDAEIKTERNIVSETKTIKNEENIEIKNYYNVSDDILFESQFLLNEDNLNKMDNAYNYLISEGFSSEAASGIIGNAILESSLDSSLTFNNSDHHGYYQMSDLLWERFLNWAYLNNYDTSSLTSQTIWMVEESLEDDFKYYSPTTLNNYKEMKDPSLAADAFCVAFERAVSSGNDDYGISEINGGKYQKLNQRKEWAKFVYNHYN